MQCTLIESKKYRLAQQSTKYGWNTQKSLKYG